MTKDQLMNVTDDVLEIIVHQGEKRLEGQCAFADVQDARGGALVGASASLAAASVAVGAAATEIFKSFGPVSVGATIATLGFSFAAFLALWASRACNFHSAGWYPNDFARDIEARATAKELRADFALDLQYRLSKNRTALSRRGDLYNWATILLICTPVVSLAFAYLAV